MILTITHWSRRKEQLRHLRRRALVAAGVGSPFGVGGTTHADLALLRALTLERELRLASFTRSRESAAAMTRGVIEAVLRGLYVLSLPDHGRESLGKETTGHMRKFSYFGDPQARDVFQSTADIFAEDFQHGMANLRQMSDWVDEHYNFLAFPDQKFGNYLYHDWYLPLSNLSIHPSAASLSRHYKVRSSIILERPWRVISQRSAVRVADGAISYLLAAILESRNEDAEWEHEFARKQITAANIPVATLFAKIVMGQGILAISRAVYAGIKNRSAFDVNAPREQRLQSMRNLFRTLNPTFSDEEVERFAHALIGAADGDTQQTSGKP